ncbi:MAG: M48 family metallopeptidase [Planctomycetaceae bacterium]|nr:M48 family metallopeptidase [Planctomycetaceae bacterium]
MATDFFERQDQARRSSTLLVVLFVLGVIGIVGATMGVAWVALEAVQHQKQLSDGDIDALLDNPLYESPEELALPVGAGGAALLLIVGGSLFKVAQLSGGGHVVAESLQGRRVYPDTTDAVEKRLLNVVEEMALASGVPVPPVFILDQEQGINAFAAGYSPSDAVVAVTRGTAENLSRDELQGVVAHEFSHILNGDMRLNIRLIGILHGILLLGLIGRIVFRMAAHSGGSRSNRDSKGNSAVYFLLVGLAVMALGFLGTLMGNIIKAALSRQREYLADASAVQFTRNPSGLAGALKRIGGAETGSKLQAANASEASHLFFEQGVWEGLTSLTATHPPLPKRIKRLEPQWDGSYDMPPLTPTAFNSPGPAAVGLVGAGAGMMSPEAMIGLAAAASQSEEMVPVAIVAKAADQVGDPKERHQKYAAALVESLPPLVRDSVHEPYGARAVLFGLLADKNPEIRAKQLKRLRELAKPDIADLTDKLLPYIDLLDVRARLPLVDMSLPALRAMSAPQYREFLACFKELVAADNRLGLFEWTLYRVLLRHLTPQFEKTAAPRVAYYGLQQMGPQCSVLLSTLAYADNRKAEAPAALARGAEKLKGIDVQLLPPEQCGLEQLSRALDDLSRVADKKRRPLVAACAAVICADSEVTVAEAELLRGVCDMLDCPMPPLLPGGPAIFSHDSVTP